MIKKVESKEKMKIQTVINGKSYEKEVEPRKLFSDFLREDVGLTGTHVGCEHGVCGACTVLMDGKAVRSCLMFAVQADGTKIETVEGLVNNKTGRSLKAAFSEHHALQCGFCTPGILMSSVEFLNENPQPEKQEIKEMLSGHLCRCTGYTGIVEAVQQTTDGNSK
ncbi:(2Fe-2S)-binding protein [Alteribacillus sp. YIM 98480]|uniref:(2Fe-2S)-binding protein n=1 Tax=Alteribacillus sp. YIM 98480 TaxID=2606599 RepID=UPI0027147B9C|nr:(2Fe-2S)-binding protein [Alteribacillus sp. YIM 98480]